MVHAAFFLSGLSGLVYQVIWVRQLGNLFGNTVQSVALVTALFMCGLGFGSFWAGGWADRRARLGRLDPLRAYAGLELAIGALGFGLLSLFPHLSGLSAQVSGYVQGADGWYQLSVGSLAARFVVLALLLAPSTLLMGATLTLLIRHVLANGLDDAGFRVGVLYGINTLGAAAGALVTDLALVPRLGLSGAQGVAVGLNVAAALLALLAARQSAPVLPPLSAAASGGPAADRDGGRMLLPLAVTLALSGFAGLGFEVLWFRLLASVLRQYRAVFSLLLATLLLFLWVGALLGGWLSRRFGRPAVILVAAQALVAVTALSLLSRFRGADVDAYFGALQRAASLGQPVSAWQEIWGNLRPILFVVALPATCMGLAFPVASAGAQRVEAAVGWRSGALYLANTLGALAGSLLTGFVLLPWLGKQGTAFVLAMVAGAAALPLVAAALAGALPTREALTLRRWAPALLALLVLLAVGWQTQPPDLLLKQSFTALAHLGPYDRVLEQKEGATEAVVIVDLNGEGRMLMTNGHAMASTVPWAQRYMRLASHGPLLLHPDPKDVLVICFGVGNTTHAASLHPSVRRLEVADLSRLILSQAHHFSPAHAALLHDPRVQVFVADGRQHLRMQPSGSYDLVTLEPPPIANAGVSVLYSHEFYALVRERLKPGGLASQWLPLDQVPPATGKSLVRAFLDVFPNAVLLSGYGTQLLLVGRADDQPIVLEPDWIRRRLDERPRVREDLARLELGTVERLAGTFVASNRTLHRIAADVPALTDDRPSMEYSRLSNFRREPLSSEFFALEDAESFCPRCFGPGEEALASALRRDLDALARQYVSRAFLERSEFELPASEL